MAKRRRQRVERAGRGEEGAPPDRNRGSPQSADQPLIPTPVDCQVSTEAIHAGADGPSPVRGRHRSDGPRQPPLRLLRENDAYHGIKPSGVTEAEAQEALGAAGARRSSPR